MLFAVLLPVFLLLVALVSEIGRIWAYHTKLQNAADAAALAGAANFVNGDTIDSHPNADLFADRYVTANLGHNLASSPNLQQFQAKTKAATGSEGEKSYYRVHLEEEIPPDPGHRRLAPPAHVPGKGHCRGADWEGRDQWGRGRKETGEDD